MLAGIDTKGVTSSILKGTICSFGEEIHNIHGVIIQTNFFFFNNEQAYFRGKVSKTLFEALKVAGSAK